MTRGARWFAASLLMVGIAVGGTTAGAFDVALVPGHIQSSSSFDDAYMFDAAGDSVSVTVQTGLLSFRPRGGGAPILHNGSAVNVSGSSASGIFGFGCWFTPTPPVTLNRDGSASLSFDSSAPSVTPCPGFPTAVLPMSAAPAPLDLQPFEGIVTPVRLSVQWSAQVNPTDLRSTINTTCGGFTGTETQSTSDGASSATATIDSLTVEGPDPATGTVVAVPLTGSFDTTGGFGDIATTSDDMVINGPTTGTCGPFGTGG
jgi:hypothetical protein